MMEFVEKCLHSELWHACAGGMVQMPPVDSKVFYFPQGHAEHTQTCVDFSVLPRIPSMILCRVVSVKYLADQETDEVYAKIRLIPISADEHGFDEDGVLKGSGSESNEKPNSFTKTLTQSDANNGGGFSVPRYCAETIFPQLDYNADPPVQNVIARDVHGETWKFRHIYRGTPRRHLLTTGWSTFVNQKRLVAGDSIVFLRVENGDLCVGIRRAKKESSSVWSSDSAANYGGLPGFTNGDEDKVMHRSSRDRGKVGPEFVIESAFLAASCQPFEIFYYPRASTPEFFVKAAAVTAALRIQWCSGMRFKMAFETEDSARISWFMGSLSSLQVADPITWPNSPWRILQVAWDEPDLLQNVKCVSPWLVEVITHMPVIRLSPFSPPRKKLCLPHHPDFPFDGYIPMPSFSGNPLSPSSPFCHLTESMTAGIQEARHSQRGVPLSDLHVNKPQMGLFPVSVPILDPFSKFPNRTSGDNVNGNEYISCLLSMGNSNWKSDKNGTAKRPQFVLFGQPILTEQQMSCDVTSDQSSTLLEDPHFLKQDYHDTCYCKVFLESEDVGRTLDLSVLGSYAELFRKLEHFFGIERSEMTGHLCYHDATGAVKRAGEEPFSEFIKNAKRLTILMKQSSSISVSKWLTGLATAECGLDSSNQAGALSIFA